MDGSDESLDVRAKQDTYRSPLVLVCPSVMTHI